MRSTMIVSSAFLVTLFPSGAAVWSGARSVLEHHRVPLSGKHRKARTLKADDLYHTGDQLTMSIDHGGSYEKKS